MYFDGQNCGKAFEDPFDFVIIGSGAAGAVAARVLADTGAKIAVLEEGPPVSQSDFSNKLYPIAKKFIRQMVFQLAHGRAFTPILQGRCLGGSTVINSAIMWRLPTDVWSEWSRDYGLDKALPYEALEGCWDILDRELNIRPTPREVWGENNRLMQVGADLLGIKANPTKRADKGCTGSNRCTTGCPADAKQSMHLTYIPYAEKRGTTFLTNARAQKIIMRGNKAVAVKGKLVSGKKMVLHARRGVMMAASVVQTPGLLRKSGIRSPHLGRHFQGHPGVAFIGFFEKEINPWFGATQGYEVNHYHAEGFKIETLAFPPEIALTRLPGVGNQWCSSMPELKKAVFWVVHIRAVAEGRIREFPTGIDIAYDLTARDMVTLRKGILKTLDLLFAAGARFVATGIWGLPDRIKAGEITSIEQLPESPAAYSFMMTHLFGTARMSVKSSEGVVGPDFAVHGTENLYVLDSSLFPTSIGVNPQLAIMGIAMHGARRIMEKFAF